MNKFKTLKSKTEFLHKERASKFYAFVFPIDSEESFKKVLEEIKKKHSQAGHHCYAFRLGIHGENYRYSDDGEPNNSAGKPMYGQLLSSEVTNVGAVVSRYFGGTKLGVGGLVSAYKDAVRLAIESGDIVIEVLKSIYEITYTYEQISTVNQLISKWQLEIKSSDFTDICTQTIACSLEITESFEEECLEKQIKFKRKSS